MSAVFEPCDEYWFIAYIQEIHGEARLAPPQTSLKKSKIQAEISIPVRSISLITGLGEAKSFSSKG